MKETILITICALFLVGATKLGDHRDVGGQWTIVRHMNKKDWSKNIVIFPCMTHADMTRDLIDGDHVYKFCKKSKDGFYRWFGPPLSEQEFSK